jgi:hypothetical protein
VHPDLFQRDRRGVVSRNYLTHIDNPGNLVGRRVDVGELICLHRLTVSLRRHISGDVATGNIIWGAAGAVPHLPVMPRTLVSSDHHNAVVPPPDDTCFMLGDIALGVRSDSLRHIARMNGIESPAPEFSSKRP